MRRANLGRRIRRSPRRGRFRRGRRGVVSVIGTLLALLVFFALFGIFLTQYLPLWMTDNESELTNEAESSLAMLKAGIDTQWAFDGPPEYTVPFTMSSQAVPLLAQPTGAILSLLPPYCVGGFSSTTPGKPVEPQNCVYEYLSLTSSGTLTQNHSYAVWSASGSVELQIPNRYYTPQTFFFEDDGLIQSQPGGHQWMLLPPTLNVSRVGTNVTVRDTFLEVFTNSSEFIGQGTEDLTSHLLFSNVVSSADRFVSGTTSEPFTVTYTVGTLNLCAWYGYLSGLKNASVNETNPTGTITLSVLNDTTSIAPPFASGVCTNSDKVTYDLTLTIPKVTYASLFSAGVQLSLNVGGV